MTPEDQRKWNAEMRGYAEKRFNSAKSVAEKWPYWQWLCGGACAHSDARCRCAARDGKVFHHTDPIWTKLTPIHSGCGCRFRHLTQQDLEAKGLKVSSGLDFMSPAEKSRIPG